MATWQDVRRHAMALPGVTEETRSGGRAWIVNKKLVAWERPLRRPDIVALGEDAPTGPVLGVHALDLEFKELLLANDPCVFFTTPHFDGYPAVLVRLAAISGKQLRNVLLEAWLARASKKAVAAFRQS